MAEKSHTHTLQTIASLNSYILKTSDNLKLILNSYNLQHKHTRLTQIPKTDAYFTYKADLVSR